MVTRMSASAEVRLMMDKPCVRVLEAVRKGNCRVPAEGLQSADVEQLTARAVRLAVVELDAASETGHLSHKVRQLADRTVAAGPYVDVRHHRLCGRPVRFGIELHDMHAGRGHVVDMEEFAARLTAPPDGDGCRTSLCCLVKPSQ